MLKILTKPKLEDAMKTKTHDEFLATCSRNRSKVLQYRATMRRRFPKCVRKKREAAIWKEGFVILREYGPHWRSSKKFFYLLKKVSGVSEKKETGRLQVFETDPNSVKGLP